MKNILLLVHDDKGQEARLQAALDLARALGGHVRCVDVTMIPAVVMDDFADAGSAILLDDEREREGRNKAALTARLAHEDVSWDWIDVTASLPAGLLEAAALADIIVLNCGRAGAPTMREVASQVVMRGRAPVLAVPDKLDHLALDRALVAWDGQASCAATLRACTPLLARAEAVEIFMVRDGAEKTEPEEAAEYLSRHGIHADIRVIRDGLHAPDLLIEQECAAWRADYVLMGAYGRGRLMETFGGVTRRMLGKARLPLLLGH